MNISERRKWNNLLIFVCCAFILILFLSARQQGEKNLNEVYPPQDITKIAFSSPAHTYSFQNKKDNWQLIKPFKYSGVAERIAEINAIQNSDIYKNIKNVEDITEFGFNDDHYLKLNKQKIFFGDKAINSEHRYIKIKERIFLIDDRIYALLSSGPAYWLDKHILTSSELLTSISINDRLYKEEALINLADSWYDITAKNLLYPADNFITPSSEDTPITITFANNETLQFIMHKQRFLLNTTFNLAYELDLADAEKLFKP